jgi:hypothetical protein
MSSISDDIINGLDKSTDFTAKLSKLLHIPSNRIKSLTEPLGLKDYMNLSKAVDEEDPESAKRILLTGYTKLDDISKKLISEYTSIGSTGTTKAASAGNIKGNNDTTPEEPVNPKSKEDDADDETSQAIDKIAKSPEFAKIVKFADIVAKNKKQ